MRFLRAVHKNDTFTNTKKNTPHKSNHLDSIFNFTITYNVKMKKKEKKKKKIASIDHSVNHLNGIHHSTLKARQAWLMLQRLYGA